LAAADVALKRTPLYAAHRRAGAKMVEFAGWDMPVQYRGVIEEHLAVRGAAGLFDVSHMGEIEVRGAGALDFCQRLTANDVARLQLFQAQYSFLLNEQGGVVDDVIIYRVKPEAYFICVNAANVDKDFAWLAGRAGADVELDNQSAMYAQLALQGPAAEAILQPLTAQPLTEIKSFQFRFDQLCGGLLTHHEELVWGVHWYECQNIIKVRSNGFAFNDPWVDSVQPLNVDQKHFPILRAYHHEVGERRRIAHREGDLVAALA